MHLDWLLLQDVLSKWETSTHTFWIGALELAPTYEEYLQLSELPHRPGILPLPRLFTPQDGLPSILKINAAAACMLVTPQKTILIEELMKFRNCPYQTGQPEGQTPTRAYILTFIGMVLYPFTANSIHGRAVYLARAILEDKPFIPNVLGETYFNISRIHERARQGVRHHRSTCCWQLLQAWVITHLSKAQCHINKGHQRGLLERLVEGTCLPDRRASLLRQYQEEVTEEGLLHKAKYLKTGPVIVGSRDGPYIPIMGFTGSAHYVPGRVVHQFGGRPELIPPNMPRRPLLDLDTLEAAKTKTQRAIAHITNVWHQLETTAFEISEESQHEEALQANKRPRISRWDV